MLKSKKKTRIFKYIVLMELCCGVKVFALSDFQVNTDESLREYCTGHKPKNGIVSLFFKENLSGSLSSCK